MGNPKNKYEPAKQKVKNKSICKRSSAQKENMPKNKKTIASTKPNPDDGIAMSKQLLLKKNTARTQRRSSTKPERICPNGKPIPSLAELEKMFEDSDDGDETPKIPKPNPTCTTSTPEKQTPSDMNENIVLSPTTISKITERLLGSIKKEDLPDPIEVLEATSLLCGKTPPPSPILPLKKRKIREEPYIVGCKDRPQVISRPSTNFCKGSEEYGVVDSGEDPDDQIPSKRAKKSRIPNYSKSIFNAHSDKIAERLIKDDDPGSLSDASSDSNKTIEYVPILFQNTRPHSFSPLPSTSTDSETFKKNDELFNDSLKEMELMNASPMKKIKGVQISSKSSPKEKEDNGQKTNETTPKNEGDLPITKNPPQKNEDDIQIIDISYDTIVIEDNCERTVDKQNTSDAVDTNDIEIIEPVRSAEVTRPKQDTTNHKIPHDDDCMIVASAKSVQVNLDEPIIIDDEYSSINMEYDSSNSETIEIIDVDEIIAENKSILDKWKAGGGAIELRKINAVVDVPTTCRNWTSLQPVTPSTSRATLDNETPRTHQPAVIPNTTLQTNMPPSPNNSLNRTNRKRANNKRNNRGRAPSVNDSQGYVFQNILTRFFEEIQSSRPLSNPNNNATTGVPEYRLHTARDNTDSITMLSTPAITVTPIPNNTLQEDTRQSDLNDSSNSLSSKPQETSTLILPPSPTPARSLGDCPICLDPLNASIASTFCGHVFCLKCIKASIKSSGKKCPTCRKVLKGTGGGYHQIFL